MHLGFVCAIIGSVVAVLGVFQPPGWVWALSLLWVFLFGLLNYDHHRDRVSILHGLKRRDNALVYTWLVDVMLGGMRRMLSPKDAENDPKPVNSRIAQFGWFLAPRARDLDDLKHLQASTFSWPVMDAALKIAVIYPLLMLLCQWGITGRDTGIGAVTILFAEDRAWLRAALVCPVAALTVTRILASASQKRVFEEASDWLYFLSGAVALAGAFAISGAGAFAISGALALAFAFAVAVGYGCSHGKGGRAYFIFVVAVWASLVVASGLSANALETDRRALVFAIGLLPLINAIFDFLSYGITLGLIRYGRGQRNLLTGLVWVFDGVVAVLLLIGLGLVLSGTNALINLLSGQEFIALRSVFDDLKTPEGRADYTWLTLTLLSTLVPTLVHLVLVFLSAFTWVPQRFKIWIARGIEDQDTGDLATLGGSAAAATLGALWAAFVACGLWLMWLFITAYLEPAGLGSRPIDLVAIGASD
ncbi:hypothetical protein [Sedimentitalea sp.]|uniref:hypothetical protein n=1 Tax=Sedimentitalea sp. TaxID=2048915 RepID=UPI003299D337